MNPSFFWGGGGESHNRGARAGAHAPEGEGSASAAGPTAQSEYPEARKAAWAANATPSWAPRRAGRAALTTAIAAASVTIVPVRQRWRRLGFDLGGRRGEGEGSLGGGRWVWVFGGFGRSQGTPRRSSTRRAFVPSELTDGPVASSTLRGCPPS